MQRVSRAEVRIADAVVGSIDAGLLALVGFEVDDDPQRVSRLFQRMLRYRIFPDDRGRMNQSLLEVAGGLLLVPQFTLVADTRRGLRPGFSRGADPAHGQALFSHLVAVAGEAGLEVQTGRFGADMAVELVNQGPATFWLEG